MFEKEVPYLDSGQEEFNLWNMVQILSPGAMERFTQCLKPTMPSVRWSNQAFHSSFES